MSFPRALTFILLLLATIKISIAQPSPQWSTRVNYSKDYLPGNHHTSDGYTYLFSDTQVNLIKKERYHSIAMKITDENGLSEVSSITIDYDKEYEQLKFNHVHIIRNNKTIDVLKLQKPEILRRETGLEKGITDGELTLYLEVNDLRVGDILEYSYTKKGWNPIKKDFLFLRYNLAFSVPIGKIHVSFITNQKNKYTYKLTNAANKPTVEKVNGATRYTWLADNPTVITHNDNEPYWYNPYPQVFFYSKSTWNQLARHMRTLYSSDQTLSKEIKDLLSEIKSNNDKPNDQILEAIRYVQNNIRYMGNENGIYGYKPRHPNTIMDKKSGDCKEKSWLLCTLIKELGHRAYPMLVNTDYGYRLKEFPASLESFDHCVTCLIANGDTIYVDPTISNQGGDLKNICFPNYHHGLIIDKNTKDLVDIPCTYTKETIIEETYNIPDLSGTAELHVKSTYKGTEADNQRSNFKNSSKQNMQDGYLEFYAGTYPQIDTLKMLSFEDDLLKNEFIVYESYKLQNIWETLDSTKPKDITTYFYAQTLKGLLNIDVEPQRQSPMLLRHKRKIDQTIIVYLPKTWNLDSEVDSIKGPGFEFHKNIKYENKKLTLNYTHFINKPFITKDEYNTYVEQNQKVREELSYGIISYGSSDPDSNGPARPIVIIVTFLIATIGLMMAYRYYLFDPAVKSNYINSNNPIGGWLVLPAIGISLTPIIMFISLYKNGYFNSEIWGGLLNPETSNYSLTHSLIFFGEFTFNILFIIFALLASILFLFRRSSTPQVMIAFYVSNSVFIILDSILTSTLNISSETAFDQEIFKAIIRMGIWVPYFMKSPRVKETFTKRLKLTSKTENIVSPNEK